MKRDLIPESIQFEGTYRHGLIHRITVIGRDSINEGSNPSVPKFRDKKKRKETR